MLLLLLLLLLRLLLRIACLEDSNGFWVQVVVAIYSSFTSLGNVARALNKTSAHRKLGAIVRMICYVCSARSSMML